MKRYPFALASVLLLASCAGGGADGDTTARQEQNGLLSYVGDPSVEVVTRGPVDFPYDAASYEALIARCHDAVPAERVQAIERALAGTKGTSYSFVHEDASPGDRAFVVTLFPNALPYADIKQFQNDFAPCAPGGDYYPHAISAKSILFVNSCGAGTAKADDLSTCDKAKKLVLRSIVPL